MLVVRYTANPKQKKSIIVTGQLARFAQSAHRAYYCPALKGKYKHCGNSSTEIETILNTDFDHNKILIVETQLLG